ncbi:MAG: 1-acyl-sn-glycerol-3-phosphate acyltransferase [Clostridiales bacterium]|nr:1-acyl-sn-glycerol-3-phosphate acyltransferase [Clostridiales bacterium]
MIIGGNKQAVIANIRQSACVGKLNDKVEVDDPTLTPKKEQELLERFIKKGGSIEYHWRNRIARIALDIGARFVNRKTEYTGLEVMRNLEIGAIITSNHFNPLDNTAIRMAVRKSGKKRLFIVSQPSNLAMKGWIGFFMNYADILPLSDDQAYMRKKFPKMLKNVLEGKEFILIYPEQEMWYNYRKPRPPKRGAYYYAAKFMVPIIPCFVEIRDLPEKETEEFYRIQFVVHVLKPIYPDESLSVRENSVRMMKEDYQQKKQAYEDCYGKPLTYDFEDGDIAGWIPEEERD